MDTLVSVTLTLLLAVAAFPPDATAKWVKFYGRNRNRHRDDSNFDTEFEDLQAFEQRYKAMQQEYYEPNDIGSLDELRYNDDFGKMGFGASDSNFVPFAKTSTFDYGTMRSGGSSMRKGDAGYDMETLGRPNRGASSYNTMGTSYGMDSAINDGKYNYGSSTDGGSYGSIYGSSPHLGQRSWYGKIGTGRNRGAVGGSGYANAKMASSRYNQQQSNDYSYPGSADDGHAYFN